MKCWFNIKQINIIKKKKEKKKIEKVELLYCWEKTGGFETKKLADYVCVW